MSQPYSSRGRRFASFMALFVLLVVAAAASSDIRASSPTAGDGGDGRTHMWHADYNMEWLGVRTSGDQLLNAGGPYQFSYTWSFGILNDPTAPLSAATISVAPANGAPAFSAPGVNEGVTLDPSTVSG